MNDKKKSFWILLIFFSILALAVMVINQSAGDSGEMGLSMGGMMKMHTNQLKAADLLKPGPVDHGMGDISNHHNIEPLVASLGFLTTVVIFVGLPLLLGGAVLLMVLWI
ncbi:MAG: hypothetical protein ACYDG6_04255 [Thermincolia bacterium]